jgi:hypothetical protein
MKTIKKIIVAVTMVVIFAVGSLMGQGVQAGISANSDTLIISAKPSVVFTGQNYSAGNISIRWLTSSGVSLGTPIANIGSWVTDVSATSGAFSYATFNFVAGATIPLNWTAGSENVLFKVVINQTGNGTGTFELAPSGFVLGGQWYFELAGNDSTNYTQNFYVASVDAALPVEISSFSASAADRHVNLQWATATEKNSHSFEVERNQGEGWSKVGELKASGNTNAPKNYSFTDKLTALKGDSISYRLKMVDNDGKFAYSKIASAKAVPIVFALEQNYPNPFNPETKIQFSIPQDAKVALKIYDITGREIATVVNEDRKAGYYEEKFGGFSFSSGVYFYRIIAESNGKVAFTKVKKMMMLK